MKPIDFRNSTFADLQVRLGGLRERVHLAWTAYGPGTTEEVCGKAFPDPRFILSFRPRTTELFQLGYIKLADDQPERGEGVYVIRSTEEHARWFAQQQREARTPQRQLALGGV